MPYKTKQQMIDDKDFIQTKEDLLNDKVLNWPHNILANNMDATKPREDIVSLVSGEEYSTFMDENTPNYNDPNTGTKTKFVQNGMSFKEAIIALDRAAKNLKNLILSKSTLPVNMSPFISPGGAKQLEPGEAYNSWALIPDGPAVEIKEGPRIRAPHITPRILYTGQITGGQDLVAIGVSPNGFNGGTAKVFSSYDLGKTWKNTGGSFSANIMDYWSYAKEWCSLYTNASKELVVLMGRKDSSLVMFGKVIWNILDKVWKDKSNEYNHIQDWNRSATLDQLDLKDAKKKDKETAWAWIARDGKTIRVAVSNEDFVTRMSKLGSGTVPNNALDINYGALQFAEVNSPSIVFFEENSPRDMFVVFSGRLRGEDRYGIYQATFENGAGNSLTQVTTYGEYVHPLIVSDNYDYVSPSFIEFVSGFIGLSFTTNEEQPSKDDIRTIEMMLYNKMTRSWFGKSIIYIQEPIIGWSPGRSNWPRATIVEGSGQIICFVEELMSKKDMKDFSTGRFAGVEKAYTRLKRINLGVKV
jgi:hypothetical protein